LAIIAAFDQRLVNILGCSLAALNIGFATIFWIGYTLELRRSKNYADRNGKVTTNSNGKVTTNSNDRELIYAIKEWNFMQAILQDFSEGAKDQDLRLELLDGLPFMHSRIVMAIATDLVAREAAKHQYCTFGATKEKVNRYYSHPLRKDGKEYQEILVRVTSEYKNAMGSAAKGPQSLLDIAHAHNLVWVLEVLGGDGSAEEGLMNPLQTDSGKTSKAGLGHEIEMVSKPFAKKADNIKSIPKAPLPPPSKGLNTPPLGLTAPPPPPRPSTTSSTSTTPKILIGNTPPAGLKAPPPPPLPTPTPPPVPTTSDPDQWIRATDVNGKLYFIHRETNETVWKIPV